MILYPQRELAVGASQTGKVMNSPWSCNCEGRNSNCRKPPLVENERMCEPIGTH